MNQHSILRHTKIALFSGVATLTTLAPAARAQSSDPVVDVLLEKGIITQKEATNVEAEIASRRTNLVNEISESQSSKWKMSNSFKSLQFYGDLRLRYEYRGVDNVKGALPDTYARDRFRYSARFGIKGDLYDDFNYGIRLETANNPRSPWDTFGNNTTTGSVSPSDKNAAGIYLEQVFLGWHPTEWYEMTVGEMPMPLYTTPMVWDSDINPQGAFEKFKFTTGPVNWFVDFGQFDYQNPSSTADGLSGDTFVLAWQAGAQVATTKNSFFKIAPVFYTYVGQGDSGGLNQPYVGQGLNGKNVGIPGGTNTVPGVYDYNQQGINDLSILEIPAEFDYRFDHTALGPLQARAFGDFAYNLRGNSRADAAYAANPAAFGGLHGPVDGQNKAYQIGLGIGSAGPVYGPTQGLVYGSTSKKNTWEARAYWQHVEQYSLDVNLLDSDYFEGRGNLQGVYFAFAYGLTDCLIGTVRYGHADTINNNLGTGGNNLDLPGLNQIRNYNLLQMDLTWRF